jgi:protein subunit release factor A
MGKNNSQASKGDLAFSVTKDDCVWEYFRVGGAGGQHRDKTSAGVRVRHRESGAVGEATDSRSQLQNRKTALSRMASSPIFKGWVALQLSTGPTPEERVESDMKPENLKIEVMRDGRWSNETLTD